MGKILNPIDLRTIKLHSKELEDSFINDVEKIVLSMIVESL